MNKLFLLTSFILLFGLVINAEAQTISQNQSTESSFSINVSNILYYKDIKKTQFFINIQDPKNLQNVAYWKVSLYCDDKMSIQLTASSTNDCDKSIRFESLPNNSFPFLFKNNTSKTKDFLIKVKAFDNKGKGIHGESIGFGWK